MAKSFLSIGKPKLQFANHNLSNDYKYSCDFGQLIPVCLRECIPGDKIRYGIEAIVRLNPTIAPVLHKMDIRFEAFFVPNRLVWQDWEEFITGGVLGNSDKDIPRMTRTLSDIPFDPSPNPTSLSNTLWDYFGLPIVERNISTTGYYSTLTDEQKKVETPIQLPFRAYQLIWNEFYRDENVEGENVVDTDNMSSSKYDWNLLPIRSRRWTKNDYFTSALPFIQRSIIAPALDLDLSGIPLDIDVTVDNNPIILGGNYHFNPTSTSYMKKFVSNINSDGGNSYSSVLLAGENASPAIKNQYLGAYQGVNPDDEDEGLAKLYRSDAYASATGSIGANAGLSITASDLRWLMQTQKFLERNARGGARYVEQVLSHFGVYTGDYRLQRPEFLGSTKSPIIVSEIPQTSATQSGSSPQANLAGKGLGAVSSQFVKYRCKEHGYFIVLASIVPKLAYASQGINKMWTKRTKLDYFFPEFSHLSEQPILKQELFYNYGNSSMAEKNEDTFGYTGIYNEYRTFPDQVTGLMRDDFDYWHLARKFASEPALNSDFLDIASENNIVEGSSQVGLKRIFAVPSEPGFLVDVYNRCYMTRPIPHLAEPGLVDHF